MCSRQYSLTHTTHTHTLTHSPTHSHTHTSTLTHSLTCQMVDSYFQTIQVQLLLMKRLSKTYQNGEIWLIIVSAMNMFDSLSLPHVPRFSVSLSSAGHVTSVHYPAHERHTTLALKKTIASLLSFEQVCHTNYTCTILSKYTSYSTACCLITTVLYQLLV